MSEYIECADCGFVLQAATPSKPMPKRWDACPGCDGTEFVFPDG